MVKNIGTKDAHVRIILAAILVLAALFVVTNDVLRVVLALVGAALAATAYFRYCYLYKLLHKNTSEPDAPAASPAPAPSGDKTE